MERLCTHSRRIRIVDNHWEGRLSSCLQKDIHWTFRKNPPRKPSSVMARVNSAAATVALCMANDANPPNRSVLLAISAASWLFTVIAIAAAASGSAIPWIQGWVQEMTICEIQRENSQCYIDTQKHGYLQNPRYSRSCLEGVDCECRGDWLGVPLESLLHDISALVLLTRQRINHTKGSSCATVLQICTRGNVIRTS